MLKKSPYILAALLLCVGAIFGYSSQYFFTNAHCEGRFEFINIDLACSNERQILDKTQYIDLRKNLEVFFADKKREGVISDVAVYFRDLRYGPVMGINETADFAPASLMKTPLALFYMEIEDRSPGFFTSAPRLKFTSDIPRAPGLSFGANGSAIFGQTFTPNKELQLGEDYNIEDLLFRSLAYSDNNAYFLLVQYAMSEFGQEAMIEFLRQLGVISSSQSTDDIVTVRGYSSIFRLLYNGSLINSGLSEKVLSWLSQSTFTDGLVAGVPQNIRVSHKFGEFGFVETGKYQLHDCGIVYYPENPYLLCIMTRGGDVRALAGIIAEVSRRVYQEVDSRRL